MPGAHTMVVPRGHADVTSEMCPALLNALNELMSGLH
jgi:hypothetical protein